MSRFYLSLVMLLSLFSFSSFAEGISTHILDLSSGVGGKDVPVILEMANKKGAWSQVASGVTDGNGRIKSFGESFKARAGKYKLVFDMTKYSGSKADPFFPEISVVFNVTDENLHYHVPVVVSPYGYSTYRGN
ncbi:hydroxyisourate hydrolase [Bacteriovorax stolpii]|uniref:5-hydroxyisourate hydrolase n=1 Tax=Bacteriovorax stolpii TaxID=960 RepID=A0A2K9NPD1_BACTC|nr:hydroxyisourate hydrolase [Bacteriovorax stolpii]AUN97358.1 hydroxyisourate hydrolase [Bacteriovorax stolpii]QDK42672.1 hydroxyisourate hydrolase [Bacteriovorax stolpii]TDP52529.1 5-hydroxyisourate hydrolase [Bacteriovorax stolpii]